MTHLLLDRYTAALVKGSHTRVASHWNEVAPFCASFEEDEWPCALRQPPMN